MFLRLLTKKNSLILDDNENKNSLTYNHYLRWQFFLKVLLLFQICRIFARANRLIFNVMCIVTLEFNKGNALARRKLATGLFFKVGKN